MDDDYFDWKPLDPSVTLTCVAMSAIRPYHGPDYRDLPKVKVDPGPPVKVEYVGEVHGWKPELYNVFSNHGRMTINRIGDTFSIECVQYHWDNDTEITLYVPKEQLAELAKWLIEQTDGPRQMPT